jgi:adenylate cyclase
LSALGTALQHVKGNAAAEVGDVYARAQGLWEQLGFPSEFLHVPFVQSTYHMNRGDLDLAQRLAEDLLRLSGQRNDTAGLVLGHLSSGRNLLFFGRFASSRSHLEEALALYNPISHPHFLQYNLQSVLGNVLFCLGFPDQALARSNAAVAEALNHVDSSFLHKRRALRGTSFCNDNVC